MKKRKKSKSTTTSKPATMPTVEDALRAVVAGLDALLYRSGHDEQSQRAYLLALHAVHVLARDALQPWSEENVSKAYRVLYGGRPHDEDGVRLRRAADALGYALQVSRRPTIDDVDWLEEGERVARGMLAAIDPAFGAGNVAGAVGRLREGGKLVHVLAELLVQTAALGTNPKSDLESVRNRLRSALGK